MLVDEFYMRRALELARHGLGHTSPNPMVGAVIVAPDGRIIGEGYHRKCGEGHAEVNAVASVADRSQLRDCTMYVTLEPCSHYGKTPPCAKLITDCGIPRVVVGAGDPNPRVAGRGIAMLREAGVEVTEGVLAKESRRLNARFMTAQTLRRPFITLKWAQSADGYMDHLRSAECPGAAQFSTPLSSVMMHRLRSLHDAILVGSGTVLADNPRLDVRKWPFGEAPVPIVLDRRGRIDHGAGLAIFAGPKGDKALILRNTENLGEIMRELFEAHGITSVLIEGGAAVLKAFVDAELWDLARIETSPTVLGALGVAKAPVPAGGVPVFTSECGSNTISFYSHNALIDVKNL